MILNSGKYDDDDEHLNTSHIGKWRWSEDGNEDEDSNKDEQNMT